MGWGVPRWVEHDFRSYPRCGILAHGFARVRCTDCGHDRLLAFSCKGRGVCPSCNVRRMAEVAAHLTDEVMPPLPVRQWVLPVPKRLWPFASGPALVRPARAAGRLRGGGHAHPARDRWLLRIFDAQCLRRLRGRLRPHSGRGQSGSRAALAPLRPGASRPGSQRAPEVRRGLDWAARVRRVSGRRPRRPRPCPGVRVRSVRSPGLGDLRRLPACALPVRWPHRGVLHRPSGHPSGPGSHGAPLARSLPFLHLTPGLSPNGHLTRSPAASLARSPRLPCLLP
jgi:hypothetical protein